MEDIRACSEFEDRVCAAREACTAQLGAVLRVRRKAQNNVVPRWQEPGLDLLEYLHQGASQNGPNWKIALHMSNIQNINFTQYPHAFTPTESRTTLELLCNGPSFGTRALAQFGHGGLITWAPQDVDALHRVVASFTQYVTTAGTDTQLVLVVPHDPFPGCETPASIIDLWRHPLLGDKWQGLVKQIQFLREPTQCIFTGAVAPLYHTKAFVIVTSHHCGRLPSETVRQDTSRIRDYRDCRPFEVGGSIA